MKKVNKVVVTGLCFALFFTHATMSHAQGNEAAPSVQQQFTELGYTTVKQAVKRFQTHSHTHVRLPQVYPFTFTVSAGKADLDPLDLHITYLNETTKEIMNLDVYPTSRSPIFRRDHLYKLQDGTPVIYRPYHRHFYYFEFQKDGLRYVLGVGKRTQVAITAETFIKIAESMQ